MADKYEKKMSDGTSSVEELAIKDGPKQSAADAMGKAANAAGVPATGNHFPTGANCVINPRNSYMKRWDVVMLVLLLFTATVTPFEVGFLETKINFLFVLNRLVDVLFLKDMVMNFFLASLDLEAGLWILDHGMIAKRYLKGWFIIDLVSILPFDTVSVAMESDVVEKFKIFRIIRLFRLFKLLRIFRASRIFARWEAYISVSYSWLSLIKFMVAVLSVSHWLACFYRMVPDIEVQLDANGDVVSWMTNYDWVHDRDSAGEWYITSLYWSVMTLTTIGYGDVSPATSGERILSLIAMMIGGSIYAYVIGAVCGIVASMDEATTLYHKTMDDLNLYMEENKLPQDLRRRLREYFNNCRALQRASHYRDLLTKMSPMLRGEVAVAVNGAWIGELPFLMGINEIEREGITTEVALRMNIEAFAPNESVVKVGQDADKMYIVQRGVVSMLGRVYRSGDILGDDMILTRATRPYAVRALTFTALSTLSKEDFDDIINSGLFEEARKVVRMSAIRMSVRREFIHYANSIRALRELVPGLTGKSTRQVRVAIANSSQLQEMTRSQRSMSRLLHDDNLSPTSADAAKRKSSSSAGGAAEAGGVPAPADAGAVEAIEDAPSSGTAVASPARASAAAVSTSAIAGSPHMSGGGPVIIGKAGSRRMTGGDGDSGAGGPSRFAGTLSGLPGALASDDKASAPPVAMDSELKRVIADAERELGLPGNMPMHDDMDFDLVGDLGALTDDLPFGDGPRAAPGATTAAAGGATVSTAIVAGGPVEIDETSAFATKAAARHRSLEASVNATRSALAEKLEDLGRRMAKIEETSSGGATSSGRDPNSFVDLGMPQILVLILLLIQFILIIVLLAMQ